MAKLRCNCGYILHDNSETDNIVRWLLEDDDELELYCAAGESSAMSIDELGAIKDRMIDVWTCPKCGRFWVGNTKDNTMKPYLPES